jgi:hypothetical protein
VNIEVIRDRIGQGSYYFYAHCLVEAKKDGVGPEDILYCLQTGKIIEEYPKRKRVLVYGRLPDDVPLHVVCDLSQTNPLMIVTAYIPDDKEWIKYQKRKR